MMPLMHQVIVESRQDVTFEKKLSVHESGYMG